jgi:hypothetical protein
MGQSMLSGTLDTAWTRIPTMEPLPPDLKTDVKVKS